MGTLTQDWFIQKCFGPHLTPSVIYFKSRLVAKSGGSKMRDRYKNVKDEHTFNCLPLQHCNRAFLQYGAIGQRASFRLALWEKNVCRVCTYQVVSGDRYRLIQNSKLKRGSLEEMKPHITETPKHFICKNYPNLRQLHKWLIHPLSPIQAQNCVNQDGLRLTHYFDYMFIEIVSFSARNKQIIMRTDSSDDSRNGQRHTHTSF